MIDIAPLQQSFNHSIHLRSRIQFNRAHLDHSAPFDWTHSWNYRTMISWKMPIPKHAQTKQPPKPSTTTTRATPAQRNGPQTQQSASITATDVSAASNVQRKAAGPATRLPSVSVAGGRAATAHPTTMVETAPPNLSVATPVNSNQNKQPDCSQPNKSSSRAGATAIGGGRAGESIVYIIIILFKLFWTIMIYCSCFQLIKSKS